MKLRRPYLIGIAGPSGAGKTTLAERIARDLGAPILSLDCYYRELALPLEERACMNFDEPDALDRGLLFAQLSQLAGGTDILVPVYDFSRHTRAPETTLLRAGEFIIVEGLFALYWEEIRALFGTKVFVAAEDGLCFERRLERDTRERGRSQESVFEQYRQTVRPMAERYVLPTRAFADVVVAGTGSLDLSAAAVLDHVGQTRAIAASA
ncbi:MAG TPA: uridine kinase [Bryobacteraceae bacterium]|nr:uridine kinase [Bryobacteraceae bacterium]